MKSSKIFKIIIQAIFVILVFGFLGGSLISNWNRLDIDLSHINYVFIALSLLFFSLAWVAAALSWGYIIKKLEQSLDYSSAIKLWTWSQSARYIPGSVWQVVGRVYMGEKKGLGKGKTLASIAIETSNLIISSLIVFALSLPFWPTLEGFKSYYPFLFGGFMVFGFLHPKVFNTTTNFFVRRLDKGEKDHSYAFSEIITMLVPYLGVWLIFGLGFFFLILSLKEVGLAYVAIATGTFALSWVVGFLFVIAPGGLGAREVALVYFLGFFVSNPLAVLFAVLSRVLMIIGEVLILGISALYRR